MIKVSCSDCRHFRSKPYEAPHTGCWHPDNMASSQKDGYLDQQQLPGDERMINLRGDCASFQAKPKRLTFWERFLRMGA